MNDFLNAELRLRLKCVYLHSTRYAVGEKELSHEKVGFVLGFSKQYAKQVEEVAIQKLKRKENLFSQILEELEQ